MNNVIIQEKPDSLSWDSIHDFLWKVHEENRRNGIVMRYPSLPGEEIRKRIEANRGRFYTAFLDDRCVATAAILIKKRNSWFYHGDYPYLCFVGIDPEFLGCGIYRKLVSYVEEHEKTMGYDVILFDTHEDNQRMLDISERNGYLRVAVKQYEDHCNVLLIKYFNITPYNKLYFRLKYLVSKYKTKRKLFQYKKSYF